MTDTIAREEENEHNSLAIQPLTTALLDPRSNDNDAPLEVRISPSTDVDASSKEEKNESAPRLNIREDNISLIGWAKMLHGFFSSIS